MAETPGLLVEDVRFSYGGGTPVLAGASIRAERAEVLSLLGPSGCGKTTLLRIVAGLEVPDTGKVLVGDRELTNAARVVAPEHRRVAMVFQDWALFPHLNVADNVGFGLPRPQRRDTAVIGRALALVGLDGLAERMPGELSGGQQQRVALGRALAQRPEVLLLDEPFSNLDASLRSRVRTDVHRLLVEIGITTVLVTHDRDEAFVLGDRVAVMRDGVVVADGLPEDLYRRPPDPWTAGFIGEVVALRGEAQGTSVETSLGRLRCSTPGRGTVRVLVRPEQFSLRAPGRDRVSTADHAGCPGGLEAVVSMVEYHGPSTSYVVVSGSETVRVDEAGSPRFVAGEATILCLPEEPVAVFPGD